MIVQDKDIETTNCPICASSDKQDKYTFPPFTIVACNNCTAHYLSPRLRESAATELYANEDYFNDAHESGYSEYTEQEVSLRKTFRRFMENLQERGLTGGSLLEIGCGFGYLLDEAKPFFTTRSGTDFSAGAVERSRLLADEVYLGGLDALPAGSHYDCIVATNVLEHTYHPAKFLSTLRDHLTVGGSIVMAVPNMASFIRLLLGKKWPSFKVPEHTVYFKQDTLQRTFKDAGLSQVSAFPFPHAFSVRLIVNKFGVNLPPFFDRVCVWVPTTMTATVGFKDA